MSQGSSTLRITMFRVRIAQENRAVPQYYEVAVMKVCKDRHVFSCHSQCCLLLLLLQMRAIRPQERVVILGNKDLFSGHFLSFARKGKAFDKAFCELSWEN